MKDAAALSGDLHDFVLERARSWYLDGLAPGLPAGTVTAEIFEAVRLRRPASPVDFHKRLLGVRAFQLMPEAESLAAANKRIANILRTANTDQTASAVDPMLFDAPEEQALHREIEVLQAKHNENLEHRDYHRVLQGLATLKAPVDAFFDAVLVMADDPAIRRNRLAQLGRLRALFLDVADLSCLSASGSVPNNAGSNDR
ncbi:MAG: DALR anticodon-binding domain-containing protein [Gammaproteobacteria bacterium]